MSITNASAFFEESKLSSQDWEKIEDWFDHQILTEWHHCYVTIGLNGEVEHVQVGERDYCEGVHLVQSEAYNWLGTVKLERKWNGKRFEYTAPNGKELRNFSSFVAIILFRTEVKTVSIHSLKHVWDGSSPELWFRRTRASKHLYETTGRRYFIESPYVRRKDVGTTLHVPADFLSLTDTLFALCLAFLKDIGRHSP
jgi:hypothetical protein